MKLHQLYKNGLIKDKAVEIDKISFKKLIKMCQKFEDRMCTSRPPEVDGLRIQIWPDKSAGVYVDTWPPSTSEKLLLLSIEEVVP